MIDRGHELALIRQAKLLKLSRSSVYYRRLSTPERKRIGWPE
jgi:hypothetical protein